MFGITRSPIDFAIAGGGGQSAPELFSGQTSFESGSETTSFFTELGVANYTESISFAFQILFNNNPSSGNHNGSLANGRYIELTFTASATTVLTFKAFAYSGGGILQETLNGGSQIDRSLTDSYQIFTRTIPAGATVLRWTNAAPSDGIGFDEIAITDMIVGS